MRSFLDIAGRNSCSTDISDNPVIIVYAYNSYENIANADYETHFGTSTTAQDILGESYEL